MTPEIQGGTSLSRDEFEGGKVLSTRWVPNASYAWDTGVAIGRYLAGFKEGKILGIRCPDCGRTLVPPRTVCELDFRSLDDWVVLEDTGTVNTFSLCYVSWDVRRLTDPEIPAVIEIDGASEGIGILHRLGEVDPDEVRIGMRVQAVWKPPQQRIGSVTDIRYFKPV